jgi:SAM-dependent methyltransferase
VVNFEEDADRLARAALAGGDPTGWFEPLYAAAAEGAARVPWDRGAPNPTVTGWAGWARPGAGRSAVVVGCGYGDDAEYVAARGWDTVAFDVSPSAVRACRLRYPDSAVDYRPADLFALPPDWAFDLVVESQTVQALPRELRADATARVAALVGPGGTLLVCAAARDAGAPDDGPPWPLTRDELDGFGAGLSVVRVERLPNPAGRTAYRWRAEFRRA